MLAEEVIVIDGDSQLWRAARPLLDVALRLEQNDDAYVWHGWEKRQINRFLNNLPSPCSLVAGVWQVLPSEDNSFEREELVVGVVCEVIAGQICSIRTFEGLMEAGLKAIKELEPGFEDAVEILRAARMVVAPVAWALFIEKAAWDEWLFASGDDGAVIDKGELLAALARQGRCVLMGSRARHHHY